MKIARNILCILIIIFFITSCTGNAEEDKIVVLETNQGNIEIKLMPQVAPKACENFLGLVKKGYYDGTIFHRVIKNFMIQGGDPTATGRGGDSIWGGTFEDEVKESVKFDRPGLVAMANAGPNTNRSQFFITTVPTPSLNMHHTIFGEVVSGYDVVQKIENTPTDAKDKPLTEQKIIRAYIKGADKNNAQSQDNIQPQTKGNSLSSASGDIQANKQPKQNTNSTQEEVAGELFGVPVPLGNYYFAMRAALLFGTPWGAIPRNYKDLEKRTWTDLLLSYEAFRRNITVSDEELKAEITKNLKSYKVDFDWQKDKQAYEEWTKKTLGESPELFENQMRHLFQLRKLQQEILDSIEPTVTEEEAFQEFLNEYNTLSIELVQFDELKDAEEFYRKAKSDSDFWEQEKEKNPKRFKRPGFVALEFLMYMWKLPFKAVYDMIDMDVGSIYPPTPIYKGYGVFKVLKIRRADKNEFPKRRESYYNQLKQRKKYEGFAKWLKDLYEEANIQKYAKPPEGLFKESDSESTKSTK